jgi:hypothetical protein
MLRRYVQRILLVNPFKDVLRDLLQL